MSDEPYAVLGMGNVLLGDDGAGPTVARWLQAHYRFPDDVAVEDIGTPGLDLVPLVAGRRAVILVDTVRADGEPPGSIRLYRRDQLAAALATPRTTPHDPGLAETLAYTELSGQAPEELLVVGIVPDSTETGTGLSPAVRDAVPRAGREVLDELRRLGLTGVEERDEPEAANTWWEGRSP